MSALELRGVWKARGAARRLVQAVRGASLRLAPGEVVLVEGPSGAGKTTLLLVAAGLLTPERGSVALGGRELGGLGAPDRRALRARSVGFVFQRANLLDRLTVRENVLLAGALARLPGRRAAAEADRLLSELGLAALADRLPPTLAGGEEQRVAVARALVHGPTLVLADEPTGSLDAVSGREVAAALTALARAAGAAVLVASHDARLRAVASRRLWMADGQLSPATGEGQAGDGESPRGEDAAAIPPAR